MSEKVKKELEKAEKKFDAFEENVKSLTLDNLNTAPIKETEHKISQKEQMADGIVLKPARSLGPGVNPKTGEKEKFNERFREDYEYQKQFVKFVAYNNMISGEKIEMWTKPFPGVNCEFWQVPVNKPVWGPRYLAEQITRARHHNLVMGGSSGSDPFHERPYDTGEQVSFCGQMVAKETVQRLDAKPVSSQKSVFV